MKKLVSPEEMKELLSGGEEENIYDRYNHKVIPILTSKDAKGRFFYYCSSPKEKHWNGIIGEEKVKKCLRKNCEHLQYYRKSKN